MGEGSLQDGTRKTRSVFKLNGTQSLNVKKVYSIYYVLVKHMEVAWLGR